MSSVLSEVDSYYVLHASAASHPGGRTAVVLGPSDSGKTSTLIALLERGLTMVCDDYAPLAHESGCVTALPVGVTVSPQSVSMFPWLEAVLSPICEFAHNGQKQWTFQPADRFNIAEPYSTYGNLDFFLLEPAFGQQSRIGPCGTEESLWWLSVGSLNSKNYSPKFHSRWLEVYQRNLDAVLLALRNARVFKVRNGHIGETADLILGVVAGS